MDRLHAVLLCALASVLGTASAATPDQQYKNNLTRAQAVTPLTEFGDSISLRDGSTSFRNTDISLPGTGPTITITRTTRKAASSRPRHPGDQRSSRRTPGSHASQPTARRDPGASPG